MMRTKTDQEIEVEQLMAGLNLDDTQKEQHSNDVKLFVNELKKANVKVTVVKRRENSDLNNGKYFKLNSALKIQLKLHEDFAKYKKDPKKYCIAVKQAIVAAINSLFNDRNNLIINSVEVKISADDVVITHVREGSVEVNLIIN